MTRQPPNPNSNKCPSKVELERYAQECSLRDSDEFRGIELHIQQCEVCAKNWSVLIEKAADWGELQSRIASDSGCGKHDADFIESLARIRRSVASIAASTQSVPKIDGFELIEEIGRGASSVVYRARQESPSREIALKLLSSAFRGEARQLERFQVEIDALARLNHPNIVPILEVGQCGDAVYFTMPLIAGGSLAERLDGTPWQPNRAVKLVRDIATAVDQAHRSGIVHRDLKPGNILIDLRHDELPGNSKPSTEFLPQITDFGIAKSLAGDRSLTKTGELVGTPGYMAPEQIQGHPSEIGPAADIYAIGINLYELLTGRSPFKAETTAQTLLEVIHEDPLPPTQINKRIPRDLETICMRAIAKRPANRYASAAALCDDLDRFLNHEPIIARPVGRTERLFKWIRRHPATATLMTGAVVASIALLAMWAVFTWQIRQERDNVRQTASQLKSEREQALANFDRAFQAVHAYMQSVHNNPQLGNEKSIELRKELLQHGTDFYEDMLNHNRAVAGLPAARQTTEKVRLEQARLFFTVGKLQYITEDFAKAKKSLERALEICTRILGNELIPSRKIDGGLPGSILISIARTNVQLSDYESGLDHANRALDYFASIEQPGLITLDYLNWYLAEALLAKSLALSHSSRDEEALAALEQGVLVARELPDIPDFRLPLVQMLLERIQIHASSKNEKQWSADLIEAEAIVDGMHKLVPDALRYLSPQAEFFAAKSSWLLEQNEKETAIEHLDESVRLQSALFVDRPYGRIGKRVDELKQSRERLEQQLVSLRQFAPPTIERK